MKTKPFLILNILLMALAFIPNTFAQNAEPGVLPEGAKSILRLGEGYIYDVEYSPDGKLLAIAHYTGILLYNIQTREKVYLLRSDPGLLFRTGVSFSADGNTLLSSGAAGVHLWDVITGNLLHTLNRSQMRFLLTVALSPDGSILAAGGELAGGGLGVVFLWNVSTGSLLHTLTANVNRVSGVSFSPDGKTLVSSSSAGLNLWDVVTGTHKQKIVSEDHRVGRVAFSPDGETIARWTQWKGVRLWDAKTGTLLHGFNRKIGDTDALLSIAFSPDSRTLATGSGVALRIWDVSTGSLLRILSEGRNSRNLHSVSFSPDGRTLVSGDANGNVIFWNANPGTHFLGVPQGIPPRTLIGHRGSVFTLAFSPDGSTLASGGWDKTIRFWDVKTSSLLRTLTKHTDKVTGVAFSPDGRTLASSSWDRTVRLWDVDTGNLLHTLIEHTDRVTGVSFSSDGRTLASGGRDKTIHFWNVNTGDLLRTIVTDSWVTGVSFGRDDQILASGVYNRGVFVWDVGTGNLLHKFQSLRYGFDNLILGVSFSPDENTLAAWLHLSWWPQGDVRIWDANKGRSVGTLKGHTNDVTSVSFSADGKTLASGSYDYTIRFWDVETKFLLRRITGHTYLVTGVAFSPDGKTLASATADGTCFLWNIPSLQLPEDVNKDGIVNIQDLIVVANAFGEAKPDLNGDGVVNIQDLVIVASAFGNTVADP